MLGSPDLVMDLPVRLSLRRANPYRLGNLLAPNFSLDQGTDGDVLQQYQFPASTKHVELRIFGDSAGRAANGEGCQGKRFPGSLPMLLHETSRFRDVNFGNAMNRVSLVGSGGIQITSASSSAPVNWLLYSSA